TPTLSHLRCPLRELICLGGIIRILPDSAIQLFHAGGCLLQRCRLLLSTTAEVSIAAIDFVSPGADCQHTGTHFGDNLHEAVLHALHRGKQLTDFIVIGSFYRLGEIPAGNAAKDTTRTTQRLEHNGHQKQISHQADPQRGRDAEGNQTHNHAELRSLVGMDAVYDVLLVLCQCSNRFKERFFKIECRALEVALVSSGIIVFNQPHEWAEPPIEGRLEGIADTVVDGGSGAKCIDPLLIMVEGRNGFIVLTTSKNLEV